MRTFRRLNDPTRYYGLSWRGWIACGVAGGVLYLAIRLSPFGVKPTLTLCVFLLATAGMALYALGGQALGPGRYFAAVVRWRTGPRRYLPATAGHPRSGGGVVVDAVPLELAEPEEHPRSSHDLTEALR
jgi:hypothetical protein